MIRARPALCALVAVATHVAAVAPPAHAEPPPASPAEAPATDAPPPTTPSTTAPTTTPATTEPTATPSTTPSTTEPTVTTPSTTETTTTTPPTAAPPKASETVTPQRPAPGAAALVVNDDGSRLRVGGRDFFVVGVNWDYVPIGQNYSYSLWQQPDEIIEAALAREMPLLQRMHVNAIRMYEGVPSRWITAIYDRYGIATVLNHPVGRYGFNIDGRWVPQVDYSDPHTRDVIAADVQRLVREHADTRGLLFWLLGNENNYGLSWASTEIEALPVGERDVARARHLYSMVGRIAAEVKKSDPGRLVALANGDLQYIDVIAAEAGAIDLFGANVYRGRSVGDLFAVVKQKLGKPVVLTEFGADAFDARRGREDDVTQARYLLAQWQELFEQSAGKAGAGNSIGGFAFQWSDGWWKYRQTERLDVHDDNASWPNGGYVEDYVAGENNMNEEWWGLCAKGPPDERGLYELRPRAAVFALSRALALDAYAPSTTPDQIRAAFTRVDLVEAAALAHAEAARDEGLDLARVRLDALRLDVTTFATGGDRRARPDVAGGGSGFDHTESFFARVRANPTSGLDAKLTLNVLGNVALNPIDELFYESRGRARLLTEQVPTSTPPSSRDFLLQGIDRLKVYDAEATWSSDWFALHAFFRAGHGHWGYEGDLFGLYREAYYGTSIDTYNADTPIGVEVAGRRQLDGLKLAFGPELWWGANPAAIAKYTLPLGPVTTSVMYTEQFARQQTVLTSTTVPEQATRKATVAAATRVGPVGFEAGGIWAGSTRIGQGFANVKDDGDVVTVKQDEVLWTDTVGGKAKATLELGPAHAYVQGAYMGLVADGGPQSTVTYTGWQLRDSGLGNQANALAGVAVDIGAVQIAPNVLWQRPLVGPVPSGLPEAAPRNVLADPFAVRGNRETLAGELLLTFDPTPATWFWAWDNDVVEDAAFAASVDVAWRHQPTTQDAGFGVTADGKLFAFDGAPPPQDLWSVDARVVSRLAPGARVVGHLYAGRGESTGTSARFPNRYGGDARVVVGDWAFAGFARFNDWGPFTYHRDFNLTYPLQLMGDASTTLGAVRWFDALQTRVGVRGTWRALNGFSNRFCPDASSLRGDGSCDPLSGPSPWGSEYEVRTYLTVGL